MAGYAAMNSLKQTMKNLLESSRISLVPRLPLTMYLACGEVEKFLRILLDRFNESDSSLSKSRSKLNALNARIRDAAREFEDLLESHLADQIILSRLNKDGASVSIDLQIPEREFDCFFETLKDFQEEFLYEVENMPPFEEDESGISSSVDFGKIDVEVVGSSRSRPLEEAKSYILWEENRPICFSFNGNPGIGKTTLAKKIFQDPEILKCFEHRSWVAMGRRCRFDEIARGILDQVDPGINQVPGGGEIGELLKRILAGKRCLIVLDDMWDPEILDQLMSCLSCESHGQIRILITTRLRALRCRSYVVRQVVWRLFSEEIKELLRKKVFDEEDFPPQLEKPAEKIALNCGGLPLMILTVADHLSKARNNDPGYWNQVANNQSAIFKEAYHETSKVLFPDFDLLDHHLKLFFLNVGGLPPQYEINLSYFVNLWSIEGSITPWPNLMVSDLENAIWFGHETRILSYKLSTMKRQSKSCHVYCWWWDLFNREASREKFLRVINDVGGLGEGLEGHRHLYLHNNSLFSLKNVFDSVRCYCASTARSLVCLGPYHMYPVKLDVGFKLLRILDALKIRFYMFLVEILDLVLLQYLALTYNGELPSSIPKLFSLQFLIIHPHVNVKSCGDSSYVPVQIWDMQELKHVEILGRNLPNPNCEATLLKLSTLLGVSPDSCTREVLRKLPNIRKLGIQIELTPFDDDRSNILSCFDHISKLKNLMKLKCSIVNPEIKNADELIASPIPVLAFPSSLMKLVLSGLGYPWECMNVVGSLPNLEVLKLRCHAFRGPKFQVGKKSFRHLHYLLIEDSDLVEWKLEHGSFENLHRLRLKNCYKLEVIDWMPDGIDVEIELVDCNPLSVICARNLQRRMKDMRTGLDVHASFDGEILI